MNVFQPYVENTTVPGTAISWTAKVTSGKSLAGAETPYTISTEFPVKMFGNQPLSNPGTITSPIDYTGNWLSTSVNPTTYEGVKRSFILKAYLSTSDDYVSPVLDMDRASVITVVNRIDNPEAAYTGGPTVGYNTVANYIDNTEVNNTSALAKYITRKVEVASPAASLHCYLLTCRAPGSDIKVYYRVLPVGSTQDFESIAWTLVNPQDPLPITGNSNDFTEAQYVLNETDLDNTMFTAFAFKIVMTSSNSSSVPLCRDFRAIAAT
jgi:hypothetical protein